MAHINISNKRLSQYLSGLFVFQLAARYGNFSNAAEALGLTQSSISQRIRRLEVDLGVTLFSRKARGVTLTNEGLRLLNSVGPAMNQIQSSLTSLMERNLKPRVRISADFAFSTFWLMPRLSQLRSELDDEVEIQILASQVPPQEGEDGCDITIHVARTNNMRAKDKLLIQERVAAVCSPDYLKRHGPLSSSADLLDLQLLSLSRPPSAEWQTWQGWFESLGIMDNRSRNYISVNNYDMVTQGAMAGEGVALGWLGLIDGLLHDGLLVQATGDVVESKAGYVMSLHRGGTAEGPERIFDWIAGQVADGNS